jgi:PhnB protein
MSTHLNPYLGFRDCAKEAMDFYQSVFGGEVTRSTFADLHGSADPAEQDKVMHSMLTTATGLVLMAADTPNSMELAPDSNHSVSLSGEDDTELRGYWEKVVRRRHRHRAAREGAMGGQLRHVCRQVRRQMDGEHRRRRVRRIQLSGRFGYRRAQPPAVTSTRARVE